MRSTIHEQLARRALSVLAQRFDVSCALNTLKAATGGEFYVCGGTIRRSLLGDKLSGDIDVILPNGDVRALDALDALAVPYERNSHGHRRYRWNALQIDIFQPCEFYTGFDDVIETLQFFDLKLNALALHVRTQTILDPFGFAASTLRDPGINWRRWSAMDSSQLVVLAIRLAKVMYESPALALSGKDADRLRRDVVPVIREADWSAVHHRFPPGQHEFLRVFESIVLGRTRQGTDAA